MSYCGGNGIALDVAQVLNSEPAYTRGLGYCCEIRALEWGRKVKEPGGFLPELDTTDSAIVEHQHLYRQARLAQTEETSDPHREPPSLD